MSFSPNVSPSGAIQMLRTVFRAWVLGLDTGCVRFTGGAGSHVGITRLPSVASVVCSSLKVEIIFVSMVIVFIFRSGLNTQEESSLFQRIAFFPDRPALQGLVLGLLFLCPQEEWYESRSY